MKTHFVSGLTGFLIAIFLGWMDHESKSVWDVFQLQNLPAIIIFSLVFYAALYGLFLIGKASFRIANEDEDSTTIH